MRDAMTMPAKPRRREAGRWKRVLAAMAVVMVVLGWRLAVYARGRHLRSIGRELVAVNLQVKNPVPNRAGSQVLFAQSSDRGVGIQVLNIQTGKRQTVFDLPEGRIWGGSLLLLEWSPDDTMLAYAKPAKGKQQQVVLCSAATATKVGALSVAGLIKGFQWLSADAFVYLNNTNDIYAAVRKGDGTWAQSRKFKGVAQPPVTGFTALSATVLAWQQSGAIWRLDLARGEPERLWRPETNRLISSYYSTGSGQMIVHAQNRDQSHQILALDLQTRAVFPMARVAEPDIGKVNWVNGGKGFAFECHDHWGDSLYLRRGTDETAERLFAEGEVIDFKARRDKVFIYGSEGNEPPGIWEYSLGTGAARCLVASTEKPFSFGKAVQHTWGTLTNGSRVITYQAWSPAHLSRQDRRPLILSQTASRWNAYPYLAAAAGCQLVAVSRKSWDEGLEHWEEDVLAVQSEFANRAGVDRKRVYLYGYSAETYRISNLAASRPDLWKGALLVSPSVLPDLSKCRLARLLVDAAELDPGQRERLSAYQAEAARAGVEVELVLHPNARHVSWSRTTEQARVERFAAYLRAQ